VVLKVWWQDATLFIYFSYFITYIHSFIKLHSYNTFIHHHSCGFSDETNFDKFIKVVKNLMEGVGNWTPVTQTFFLINPNQKLDVFLGDGSTLQNVPNCGEFKRIYLLLKPSHGTRGPPYCRLEGVGI
jgi:hypothetical protein